jgi:hypothetical protein
MKPHQHRRSGKPRSLQRDPGNRVLESTSARGKIRGTARQLVERYLQFAEEARLGGDRVASEAILQSAEHYVRLSNPVPRTENRPEKYPLYARMPITTETCSSAGDALTAVPMVAPCTGQTPEPESVIVVKAQKLPEVRSREQAETAATKRAAAAAELERVAGQHSYILAQLGLALRTE